MMDRRAFLQSASALSLGGLLLGPELLELWDRLTWKRTLFPGWSPHAPTLADWDRTMADIYATDPRYLAYLRNLVAGPRMESRVQRSGNRLWRIDTLSC